ncbi:MAG TPA: HD domain-containing protein [Aggregatilineales bacterium]|nr:HD domain-containing protein [Aggregatilineales bacterium]
MMITTQAGLISVLRSGADRPLYSADAWSPYFDDSADPFLAHLRAEWLPLKPPDALCESTLIQARDHVLDGGPGAANLWAHILRVTGYALRCAPEAHIAPEQAFMLGIFHDIGKLDESIERRPHEEIGAVMAREWLRDYFPDYVVDAIARAILKDGNGSYGWLLNDADKLDKIGATGIVRRFSASAYPGYLPVALRKLRDELQTFPSMRFATSERLAAIKKPITSEFLILASGD